MGRYRAPARPGSRYITPEGAARLRAELDHLWRVRRPAVTRAVAEAAALGDRSENAEYIYGKKELREIDRRVRFLRKRLRELVVVERRPDDPGRVFFGAWVQLEDETGGQTTYRVVGPDEFDLARGLLSMDSPLGRALLGRTAGDDVRLGLPQGEVCYTVVAVSYAAFVEIEAAAGEGRQS